MDANDALTPSRDERILELARGCLAGAAQRKIHERSLIFAWTEAFGGASEPPPGGIYNRFDERLGWTYVVPASSLTPRQSRLLGELAGFSPRSWGQRSSDGRQRLRPMDPYNVIRALAIYYLSKAGGGSSTVSDAYRRLCDAVPDAYSDTWDEPGHYATIRDLQARFGPLVVRPAA